MVCSSGLQLLSHLRLFPYIAWSVTKACHFLLCNFSSTRPLLLTSEVIPINLSLCLTSSPSGSLFSHIASHHFHINLPKAWLRSLKVFPVQRYYNSITQEHLELPCYLDDQAHIAIQKISSLVPTQHTFPVTSSIMPILEPPQQVWFVHSCLSILPHLVYLLFFSVFTC